MFEAREFALAIVLSLGAAGLSAGPALAFGAGGHGGGGGGFGGHEGGFGGREGGSAGRPEAGGFGGDRVFTGRSVGIDRGERGRGVYRDGRWFGYDCSPIGIEQGLCPDDDAY